MAVVETARDLAAPRTDFLSFFTVFLACLDFFAFLTTFLLAFLTTLPVAAAFLETDLRAVFLPVVAFRRRAAAFPTADFALVFLLVFLLAIGGRPRSVQIAVSAYGIGP